jgi:hypothetical protein
MKQLFLGRLGSFTLIGCAEAEAEEVIPHRVQRRTMGAIALFWVI